MDNRELTFKHRNLCEKIYKSYEKYDDYCAKMTVFLERYIIDFEKDELHSFYVDNMNGDGIILHIDRGKYKVLPSCCVVDMIIEHFLYVGRKLTIEEVIKVSSI